MPLTAPNAASQVADYTLHLTPAEVDSVYFALRSRADRCVERAADPNTDPRRAEDNREEAERCEHIASELLAEQRRKERAKKDC